MEHDGRDDGQIFEEGSACFGRAKYKSHFYHFNLIPLKTILFPVINVWTIDAIKNKNAKKLSGSSQSLEVVVSNGKHTAKQISPGIEGRYTQNGATESSSKSSDHAAGHSVIFSIKSPLVLELFVQHVDAPLILTHNFLFCTTLCVLLFAGGAK